MNVYQSTCVLNDMKIKIRVACYMKEKLEMTAKQ